jgi:hypothetical protein
MNPLNVSKMSFFERMENFLWAGAEALAFVYVNYRMKNIYE